MFGKRPALGPLGITLVYITLGILWILFSDHLLIILIKDNKITNSLHIIKGWFFVIFTGILLYSLINKKYQSLSNSQNVAKQKCHELLTVHEKLVAVEKQTQIYESVLLTTNQRILSEKPLDETLTLMCKELVDSIGNLLAFIALKEPEFKVNFKYMAGVQPEYLNNICARWDDSPLGKGAVGLTIRTGKTQIIKCTDLMYETWPFLKTLNAHSVAAFPLKNQEDTFGVLVLVNDTPHFAEPLAITKFENFAHQIAIAMTFAKNRLDLAHQVHHDALTGLPNRLLFNDRLQQAIAHANRKNSLIGVLFLDIDRFKLVNDTLGHDAGDQLLKEISERLQGSLREGDTLARQGGDEFLIILPDIQNKNEAGIVAKRLLETLGSPLTLDNQEVFVSGSIGITIFPFDGDSVDALVKNADTAMYHAKDQGRNNFQTYTKQLNLSAYRRLTLNNKLRKAIELEELEVFYQPQINLKNGEISGTEALLRWDSPSLGIVSPAHFIPIAEETGLIIPIGSWVLQTACSMNKSWQDKGYLPKSISVNLSGRQFYQKDLVQRIASILNETGLDPQWLELEITESIAMENLDFTAKILSKIKDMGIRISIDDFGMGFSSLNYLRRLPLDTLKIDQAFISDINPSHSGREIVNAIINLAHTLNLRVIAEGVETREQLVYLKARDCDEMQGFLFSKAVPPSEMEEMLTQDRHLKLYSYSVK